MCYHLCPWKYLFYCTDIIFEIWTFALWSARWHLEGDNSPCEITGTVITSTAVRLLSCRKVLECLRDYFGVFFMLHICGFIRSEQHFRLWNGGFGRSLHQKEALCWYWWNLIGWNWMWQNIPPITFQVFQIFSVEFLHQGYVIYYISAGNVKGLIWHIIIPNIPKIHKYCVQHFESGMTLD